LPESSLHLAYFSPQADADYVCLDLRRPDGTVVASWSVRDGDPEWDLMQNLYSEASRIAMGWDKVIEDVEQALTREDEIGLTQGPTSTATAELVASSQTLKADATSRVANFLGWAAGKWTLRDTPRGRKTQIEHVTIHQDGAYDVNGAPTYTLASIEVDPENRTVEFDKAYLSEPHIHRQEPVARRERLKIVSNDAMVGHTVDDPDHVLDYRREGNGLP
jgi:hypothetical protein